MLFTYCDSLTTSNNGVAKCATGWYFSETHTIKCLGTLGNANSDSVTCSEAWVIVHARAFDPINVDPVLLGGAIGAGFFMLFPIWAAIFGGKSLLKAMGLGGIK